MLASLMGTIAQQLRYARAPNTKITANHLFLPGFQTKLCDSFMILQYDAANFLSLLRNELVQAALAGSIIQGAWGHIALSDTDELSYSLAPPRYRKDANFVRSIEIE